jgi:transcriptional regulator
VYIPNHFAVTDPAQQLDLIERFSFGTLTSVSAGRIRTSHIPFLLERGGATGPAERGGTAPVLFGHVARANSHWSELVGATDLLVSFVGPHAYISPTWYGTPNQVPTWNYVSIEVRGRVQLLETPAQRLDLVDRLSARHERDLPQPWSSDKLDAKRRSALLDAIVAFRIDIDSIEAKAKLGQNRAPAEVRAAAAELIRRDSRSAERRLALLMLEQVD